MNRSHSLFSVFDTKVGAYMTPFPMKTTAEAIRAFLNSCRDPNTQFHSNPEDFHLYLVAEFDEQTGEIAPVNPTNVAKASDAQTE